LGRACTWNPQFNHVACFLFVLMHPFCLHSLWLTGCVLCTLSHDHL
jgi:hypothetical protein